MRRTCLSGAVLAGVLAMGVGCDTVPKADYDAAITEASMLRQELEGERSRAQRLSQQVGDLQAENQRLVAEGRTGFEGIEGAGVSSRGDDIVVSVAGDVLFASGSVDLKAESKRTLDQIAQVIQRDYPENMIAVEGYTDTDPIRKSKWETNERLSAERALAVETYLVGKGLSNDTVHSVAFGPAHPKATKKESRRVEIVILGS